MGKQVKRNALGDIEFGSGKLDWQDFRSAQHTYVFKFFDEKMNYHLPYFDLFSKTQQRLSKARKNEEYWEVELYKSPENPPYDFHIGHSNWQLAMLVEFFKEVFHEKAFEQGYQPSHKYFRIILPKSKYEDIINCINKYELLHIRSLIFEIIAIAQEIYTRDIAFWEEPANKKLITSAEKETAKTIELLEKLDTKAFRHSQGKNKKFSRLLGINFILSDGPVKVEHQWLASEFVEHFRDYYDNLHFKDWKKELARYPHNFDEDRDKLQFRFRLAQALYSLFTKSGLFPLDETAPTPNKLMLCIAEIMEFCLIPVANEGELDTVKAKSVRNWIKRYELIPLLTHAPVIFDNERLLRYFTPEFLNFGEEDKRVDALNAAAFIAYRFNIPEFMGDFSHLIQCLQGIGWVIGHQITATGVRERDTFKEYETFKKLLLDVKGKSRLATLKFTIEGDETEHSLTQRLPLYLIEEAIRAYQSQNQVEIDTELIKATVTKLENNSIEVVKEKRFNQPEERFMVQFTASFYNYLLHEIPPKEQDYRPSQMYYSIIALVLVHAGIFYTKMVDEDRAVAQVKKWHRLALAAANAGI
jgi:hypothetical protein